MKPSQIHFCQYQIKIFKLMNNSLSYKIKLTLDLVHDVSLSFKLT